jgi:hypothetical protein
VSDKQLPREVYLLESDILRRAYTGSRSLCSALRSMHPAKRAGARIHRVITDGRVRAAGWDEVTWAFFNADGTLQSHVLVREDAQ